MIRCLKNMAINVYSCIKCKIKVALGKIRNPSPTAQNTGWLFGDRALRMGLGLYVGAWVARYLGPANFGLLSYTQAFIGLFTAFATLGLDRIVVRDLVLNPDQKTRILGTTLFLRLCGSMLALFSSYILILIVRPSDKLAQVIVTILGIGMIFQSLDTIDLWFQSQVQSKYSVLAKNIAFLILAGIKILLIQVSAPMKFFAWAISLELAFGSIFLLIAYEISKEHLFKWKIDLVWAKSLLRDGWPMILSGLAIMIYMRIDQIMLGRMVGDREVGIYSVATRISEIWYFIPLAITSSIAPGLVAAKAKSEEGYYIQIQKHFRFMVLISISIVIPVTIFSSRIVLLLFGPSYASAGAILALHIWTAIFVFLGVAQGPWIVSEGLMKISLHRTLVGALVNIALNIYLIPHYGGLGAAIATLVAQIFASVIVNYFDIRTRRIFWMEINALDIRHIWKT